MGSTPTKAPLVRGEEHAVPLAWFMADGNACSIQNKRPGRRKPSECCQGSIISIGSIGVPSLIMQLLGILQLSALCAKAVAVASTVPASAVSAAAAIVVSPMTEAPAMCEEAETSTRRVVSSGRGNARTAVDARGCHQVSRWNIRRGGKLFFPASSRNYGQLTVGFVAPPSTVRFRHRSYGHDHHHAAARAPPAPRSQIGRVGLPGGVFSSSVSGVRRKRPLSSHMVTAAATAAAAAAAAVTAATIAAAAAAARGGDSVPALSTGGDSGTMNVPDGRWGGGGGDVGSRRTVLSLVRWLMAGPWFGRRKGAGTKQRQDGDREQTSSASRNDAIHAMVLKKWWVGAGMAWLVAKSFGGGKNTGSRRGRPRPVPQRTVSSGAAFVPTAPVPTIATQYPRPQSTAYPRPQSTAYPRPKVTIPTLLDLDPEDTDTQPGPMRKRANGASWRTRHQDDEERDNPLLSRFLCWFFARVIAKRAKLVEGLEVSVDARSNRDAMSGLLQSVGITFNHLELQNLHISAGATVRITGLDLKVMTLLWRRFNSFKKPFEVAGSYVFTSGDLVASSMVRRLVQNMMNATLRKLEIMATDPLSLTKSNISILRVSAKRSRLVIDGEMGYDDVKVPFSYRTSLGVKGKGHVIYLKDPEVFWENVGGSLSLPLLPLTTFDVDIGDSARIESIRIVNGQVAIRSRFVLSPFPPLVVASVSKRASFRYDVGERLSVIFGNFVQNMKII